MREDMTDVIHDISESIPSPLPALLKAHGIEAKPGPDGFYVWHESDEGSKEGIDGFEAF